MKNLVLVLVILCLQCETNRNVDINKSMYCGFHEGTYIELWFNNEEELAIFEYPQINLSLYKIVEKQDSILLFDLDGDFSLAFEIVENVRGTIKLKNTNGINVQFYDFNFPYYVDVFESFKDTFRQYDLFIDEAIHRYQFLFRYLSNDSIFFMK